MKIVVTGASGFIGRRVVASLLHVLCPEGRATVFPFSSVTILAVDRVLPTFDHPSVINVPIDLCTCSTTELELIFNAVHAVIHLAAIVDTRETFAVRRQIRRVNVEMVERIALFLRETSAQSTLQLFLHMSSVAALQPDLTSYGASKRDGEEKVRSILPPHCLVILKPHLVVGDGDPFGTAMMGSLPSVLPFIPLTAPAANRVVVVSSARIAETVVQFVLVYCLPKSERKILPSALPSVTDRKDLDTAMKAGQPSNVTTTSSYVLGEVMTLGDVTRTFYLPSRFDPGRKKPFLLLPDFVIQFCILVISLLDFVVYGVFGFAPLGWPIVRILTHGGWLSSKTEEPQSLRHAHRDALEMKKLFKDVAHLLITNDNNSPSVQVFSHQQEEIQALFRQERMLGPVRLRTPVIKAATFEAMSVTQLADFHSMFSRAQVGLSIVSYGAVSTDGRTFPSQLCFGEPSSSIISDLRHVAEAVHRAGGKVGIQLTHAGAFSCCKKPVSGRAWIFNPLTYRFSRKISDADRCRIEKDFVRATEMALEAGMDAVEVHCGHGYLLSQLLSWGEEEYVIRLVSNVVKAAKTPRHHDGKQLAVLVKFNCDENILQVCARAKRFVFECLVDALVPSGGHVMIDGLGMLRGGRPLFGMACAQTNVLNKLGVLLFGPFVIPKHTYQEAFFLSRVRTVAFLGQIPREHLAIIGGVQNPSTVLNVLKEGFGFVCLGRALLRDPHWVEKVNDVSSVSTKNFGVRQCDQCNRCIIAPTMQQKPLHCVTNQEDGIFEW